MSNLLSIMTLYNLNKTTDFLKTTTNIIYVYNSIYTVVLLLLYIYLIKYIYISTIHTTTMNNKSQQISTNNLNLTISYN